MEKERLRKKRIQDKIDRARRLLLKYIFGVFAHDIKQRKLLKEQEEQRERDLKRQKMHEELYARVEPSPQERDRECTEKMEREMAFGKCVHPHKKAVK